MNTPSIGLALAVSFAASVATVTLILDPGKSGAPPIPGGEACSNEQGEQPAAAAAKECAKPGKTASAPASNSVE